MLFASQHLEGVYETLADAGLTPLRIYFSLGRWKDLLARCWKLNIGLFKVVA